MIKTTGRRRMLVALVMILGPMSGSACGGETDPAREAESATGGPAPEAVTAARSPQSDGGSPGGGPSLASEMRALTAEADDAAAANTALMNLLPDLGRYEVDEAAVIALGREYLEAGDDAMAEVVFSYLQMAAYQVTGEVSADLWAAHGDVSLARGNTERAKDMYEVALNTAPEHAYSKERLSSIESGQEPSSAAPGPVEQGGAANRLSEGRRDDLARFRFKYADAGGSDRELWISETCYNSGVLRAVPQWGSEASWVFKSVADAVFEQVNTPAGTKPVRLEFELHYGHGGVEAVVVSGGAKGRFEEAGYLPDGFEPEMGTCD